MKRNSLLATTFLLFISFFMSASYAAETYTLDPTHTYLLWHINHLGYSTQAGKWYANGTLVLDKEKPENSKVNATIKIADIVTGLPELDKHLKGKLFFDAATYPSATFTSDKVEMTGDKSANVHGMLTLHGVTKPITLAVTFTKASVNPLTENMTVGFSATTTIKRSEFGIKTLLPALGDEVAIDIETEAYQPKKQEGL